MIFLCLLFFIEYFCNFFTIIISFGKYQHSDKNYYQLTHMKILVFFAFASLSLLTQAILIEENTKQPGDVDITGLLKLQSIVRSIDGSGNNLKHSNWGKSYTNIARRTPARYEDGKSKPV